MVELLEIKFENELNLEIEKKKTFWKTIEIEFKDCKCKLKHSLIDSIEQNCGSNLLKWSCLQI